MKKLRISLSCLLLLLSVHVTAQWVDITNLSGTTQNYSGVNVTVTSIGGSTYPMCTGGYWITPNNNNYYQFDFSSAVAGVRLVMGAVNQDEYVEFDVNGILYPIMICDFDTATIPYVFDCYDNTCIVLNNQLRNDGTVNVCGAGMVFYGPITSFKVRTPINTSGPTFKISFAPIGNNVANMSNCGVNNSIAGDFYVFNSKDCTGPNFSVFVQNYIPGMSMKTIFGDGTINNSLITSLGMSGHATISHIYQNEGSYTVKQVLYNGNNPIDSILFPYDHQFCSTMSVSFYRDSNNNCTYDPGIDGVGFTSPMQVEIDSMSVPVDTVYCTSGLTYTAYGNTGDVYSFKVLQSSNGLMVTCPVGGIITDVFQQGVNPTKYAALACPSANTFDYGVYVNIPVTGPIDQWGNIYVTNPHCYAPNATLTLQHSPKYQYQPGWGNPAPTSYTNNTLTWNLSGINADNSNPAQIYFALFEANGPLMANDTVHNHIVVNPINGDAVPTNNNIIVIDTVDASLDPNAIYVKPEGCVIPGTKLEYKITFENVGNAPAENIYILDTLPAWVNPASMELLFASHNMFTEKIYDGEQLIFKFRFPNIMLPDSSDHENCHGMVVYTIQTYNNAPIGSSFEHKAGIYFDYNLPVITNTAVTGFCWPVNVSSVSSKQDNITLYPNPATDELTIETEKQYASYTISNSIGQVLLLQAVNGTESKANIKSLVPGVYYISLKGEQGIEVRKFVKM